MDRTVRSIFAFLVLKLGSQYPIEYKLTPNTIRTIAVLRNRQGRSEPAMGLSFDVTGKLGVIGRRRYSRLSASPIPKAPQITGSSIRRRSKAGSSWTLPNAALALDFPLQLLRVYTESAT